MTKPIDTLLGVVLWTNGAGFLLALLARLSFKSWIIFDIAAVLVCGLIGFIKQVYLLQLVAGVIVVAFVLRVTLPLWILVDLFVISACAYVGYLFINGKVEQRRR